MLSLKITFIACLVYQFFYLSRTQGIMQDVQTVITPGETVTVDDSEVNQEYTNVENTSSATTDLDDTLLWQVGITYLEITTTAVGFILNFLTLMIFVISCKNLSPQTRNLLRHQSFIDTVVCLIAMPTLLQTYMWKTGNYGFDVFICQFWHSQALYWASLLISVWNLVLIAIERFLVVCRPIKYKLLSGRTIIPVFCAVYIINIISLLPVYFQTYFENGNCHNGNFFPGEHFGRFITFYGFYWFCAIYAVPVMLFVVIYCTILYTLHRRKFELSTGKTSAFDKANAQFTRSAVIVTIFFVFSLSFDSWYFMLGMAGATEYIYGSSIQRVGLLFTVLNSLVNPIIYGLSMPMFRDGVMQTFFCKSKKIAPSDSSTLSSDWKSHPSTSVYAK